MNHGEHFHGPRYDVGRKAHQRVMGILSEACQQHPAMSGDGEPNGDTVDEITVQVIRLLQERHVDLLERY